MNPKKVYLLFLSLCVIWILLILTAPYLAHKNYTYLSGHLYRIFSHVCHQRPERSFFLWGHPLGVCARCTFIYMGGLVGMLLYPLRFGKGVSFKIVVLFGIPLIIDGASQLLFRESTNEIRAVTGFLLGTVIPFYVLPKFFESLKK
ncbi:MAG: DUF2085 domain-containing protein [Euryarchaeota archaeon]|nr:DUF2085 domain-containing protein [Euryarchaeota archaeon]